MSRIRFRLITGELEKLSKVETVGPYILSVISLIAVIALVCNTIAAIADCSDCSSYPSNSINCFLIG